MKKVIFQISDGKNGLFKLRHWGLSAMKERREGGKEEGKEGKKRKEKRILLNTIRQNRKVFKNFSASLLNELNYNYFF